jgi:hypothetical protein
MEGTKEEVLAQLNEIISQSNGKAFMGMIHPTYGPLRGLNFILNDAIGEDIMNSIDEQHIEMNPEDQIKIAEELKKGKSPNNLIELVIKIWVETGLATQLMVIPNDLIDKAENPPSEFLSIKDGCKEILNVLLMTHNLQEKDPYFFRSGII